MTQRDELIRMLYEVVEGTARTRTLGFALSSKERMACISNFLNMLEAPQEVIVRWTGNGQEPKFAHPTDTGADLFVSDDIFICAGETALVPTGLNIELPKGYEGQIRCRSSMAKRGIQVANGIGSIDETFRGQLQVILYNSNQDAIQLKKGDRIAQLVIAKKVDAVKFERVDELSSTERGAEGFGSTGQ